MTEREAAKRVHLPESYWAIAGLILIWGILISQVRHHWGGESYYNFGWFVPPMAAWLLFRNLSNLVRAGKAPAAEPGASPSAYILLALLFLLPVIPIHALSEVNPFWRLPLWVQAAGISGFTLLALHRLYGWAGVRAGVFPVFFLTTMIPWPFRMEVWIVQSMTGIVIGIAVQGLHFIGYPVEMAGNSLTLDEVRIGVNEACSGIRSLQALFMVSLFLGSLFGQSVARRVLVLVILPLIVILVNTGRAIFLSLQVIVHGNEAYEYWHDPAGYIAFGVSMVLIYAAIELLNIGGSEKMPAQPMDLKRILDNWRQFPASRAALAWMLLPLVVFATVEGWFRYHELRVPPQRDWSLTLPDPADPEFTYLEISPYVEGALGYSYGTHFIHRLSERALADVYYYGFEPENRLSSVSSYGHSPAICMQATGATLLDELPSFSITVGGILIPVRHYLFQLPQSGEKVNVFWIVWENRNMNIEADALAGLNYRMQLVQLFKGRRDFSRKVVLVSIDGIQDSGRAKGIAQELLTEWIAPAAD